jgi:hypothetical protein
VQVIVQFTKLFTRMQRLRADFPWVASLLSSDSSEFERVLKIIQISAFCAIAIMALIVPIIWHSIFVNWRSRIMDMRQGRQVARSVLWSRAQSLSCRYIFDRTRINPSGSANFIGFQVLPSSIMSLMLCEECIWDVELGFFGLSILLPAAKSRPCYIHIFAAVLGFHRELRIFHRIYVLPLLFCTWAARHLPFHNNGLHLACHQEHINWPARCAEPHNCI